MNRTQDLSARLFVAYCVNLADVQDIITACAELHNDQITVQVAGFALDAIDNEAQKLADNIVNERNFFADNPCYHAGIIALNDDERARYAKKITEWHTRLQEIKNHAASERTRIYTAHIDQLARERYARKTAIREKLRLSKKARNKKGTTK